MNFPIIIMTIVLIITLFSPFGIYYAVKLVKKKDYKSHRIFQNVIFTICVLGVLALKMIIKSLGGSGSIASQSTHYDTAFFEQKQHLCELLDKNQLYVNCSSIEDEVFGGSEEEKRLNQDFYKIGG